MLVKNDLLKISTCDVLSKHITNVSFGPSFFDVHLQKSWDECRFFQICIDRGPHICSRRRRGCRTMLWWNPSRQDDIHSRRRMETTQYRLHRIYGNVWYDITKGRVFIGFRVNFPYAWVSSFCWYCCHYQKNMWFQGFASKDKFPHSRRPTVRLIAPQLEMMARMAILIVIL